MWAKWTAFYNRAKSADAAFSLVNRAWQAFWLASGSAMLAWMSTAWNQYWTTYSWAGVAFAFLVSWIGLAVALVLTGFGVRLWRDGHFWKSKAPLEVQTAPAVLIMRLNVFWFLTESPSDRGTYKLYVNLKALETIDLTRIKVRFNRLGGNGSYQLAHYAAYPHQMLAGEELKLVLIHYRPNIGTFCGYLDRVTERRNLDHLNQEERKRHLELGLDVVGPYYYCKLVAVHTRGEEPLNFTVLVPSRSERPCVLTGGADHKDYDPNRLIPATGAFLS